MRYQLYRTILRQSAFKPQFSRFQQYQRTAMSSKVSPPRIANPALFICDIQERFQKAIYQFPSVVTTTLKLLSAAKTLQIPVYITTQNKRALGDTVPEILALAKETNLIINADKSLFSMCTQEVLDKLDENTGEGGEKREVIVVGIESHICLMQTTLDLLERGHKVWVVRDGVSSCNPQEIPTALARMQQAGAVITTSESFLFECMKDSARPEFKTIAGLVKETKATTKECLEALIGPVGAQESGGINRV
ncbi:hypothetical protein TWF569_002485 [Orbilia oligospora]|uniref:Isochorismatase-like domain-containing protein n=1 Tax=Orbilia oligospora TaxID=2813651 RepID=A0A7C8KBG1_ORBOL|nr:hypothetical protein TWF102_007937 [Orbilia oligospora]KAF3106331.1 hypothetical protein TWF103_006421 [Orbilia oligospora]KAF3111011.1 hypothetical protein TWF706_000456 [Orbilia oligospora]KAF3121857.1 hypothetical protein TWF569_002485 [Orbilia oligospora]KAF3167426.1 hypothetical protein TWF751_008130 [Orbilia oligospora]